MLTIGSYQLNSRLLLAPMAGVTDYPFRKLCRQFGAGMATSEMITADRTLWSSKKSKTRLPQSDETEPRSTQIAGSEPEQMAAAAQHSVLLGAQLIDINMGCPAKKVCSKAAGSALLRDEGLVRAILEAVVAAVNVPVTLKFRTGWAETSKNAVHIAQLAEDIGIVSVALHGRTRADAYRGHAEYETIRLVKQHVNIPVIANGDINTLDDAVFILRYTHADGLMIGRAAWGQPWIFRDLAHYLHTGVCVAPLDWHVRLNVILDHIGAIHDLFGTDAGVRIARKHIGWYLERITSKLEAYKRILAITCPQKQLEAVKQTLTTLLQQESIRLH